IISLARSRLHPGPMARQFLLCGMPQAPRLRSRANHAEMAAERIEKRPMRIRINERPLVMLSMDFHERVADRAHQPHAGRLVVDEDAGTAIGGLNAPQDDVALILDRIFGQEFAGGVVAWHVENRGDLPLRCAVAYERGIAASTK